MNSFLREFKKLAVTMSATKAALREFKAAGGNLYRTQTGGGRYYSTPTTKTIEIPLKSSKLYPGSKGPRSMFFHEFGHFLDRKNLIDPTKRNVRELGRHVGGSREFTGPEAFKTPTGMLREERSANLRALNFMRRHISDPGKLKRSIDIYKRQRFPAYKRDADFHEMGRSRKKGYILPWYSGYGSKQIKP